VVVLEGSDHVDVVDDGIIRAALSELLESGASVRDAVAHVEEALGVAHRVAYVLAIELRVDDGASQ
jgi:hypothetical protein